MLGLRLGTPTWRMASRARCMTSAAMGLYLLNLLSSQSREAGPFVATQTGPVDHFRLPHMVGGGKGDHFWYLKSVGGGHLFWVGRIMPPNTIS